MSLRLRPGVVAALLTFATLSAGAPAIVAAQGRHIMVMPRGYGVPVMLDTVAVSVDIAEPPTRVFNAAVKALDQLKLDRTDHDAAHGLLANRSVTARTRFAGHPMSWMISCGVGMTGDYADTWRISLAWAVFIDSIGPSATRLGMALVAGANNVEGAYKPPVSCPSSGALEAEVAKRVKLILASDS